MRTWYVSLCARRAARRNGEPACHLAIAGGCSRRRVVRFVTGSATDGTVPQIRRCPEQREWLTCVINMPIPVIRLFETFLSNTRLVRDKPETPAIAFGAKSPGPSEAPVSYLAYPGMEIKLDSVIRRIESELRTSGCAANERIALATLRLICESRAVGESYVEHANRSLPGDNSLSHALSSHRLARRTATNEPNGLEGVRQMPKFDSDLRQHHDRRHDRGRKVAVLLCFDKHRSHREYGSGACSPEQPCTAIGK
jgi:hypothetical protein